MKKAPFKQKNRKKLFDFKGYLKGQQGLIPDIKGKSTKQSLNESQFFNPKTTDERLSDQMDSKMRASYIKEKDTNSLMYKDLVKKNKKTRPNRKNRY